MALLLVGALVAWLPAGVAASGTTPPGSNALRFSVNVLLGQPPHEQHGSPLFAWTDTETELGYTFTKYDQMKKLDEAGDCDFKGATQEVAWSTSRSTLEAQASSSSHGWDHSSNIGVSVPLGGGASVSADTTIRNAAIFGNSQTSSKQFSQRSRDYSYTFSASATRTLYSVVVDWDKMSSWDADFAAALRGLGSAPSRSELAAFAQKFGTHGLRTASLGQQCTASAFMSSEGSMTAFEDFRASSKSREAGFLWWTSSRSSSETDSNAQTHESLFSYSYANKRCIGMLKDDSPCEHGTKGGGSDRPAVVQWSYKPIWEMGVPGFHAGAKRSMNKFLEDLLAAAAQCSARSCSGKGACAPRKDAWASQSRASASVANLASFWDGSRCFCEPTRVGKSCEHGIGVAVSHPVWPAGWENDLDGVLDVTASIGGRRAAFCGIASYHDNGREDRQFKMAKCLPRDPAHQSTVGGMAGYGYTMFDDSWQYDCEHDKVMVQVWSHHSNDKEDRRFQFKCERFKDTVQGRSEWNTHWLNDWDGTFEGLCPAGKLLTGVKSEHSNDKEDRRFKFRCSELVVDDAAYNAVSISGWSAWVNDWDRTHETWAPANQAFCGMSSYHHNGHEDRRFRFKFCSVRGATQTGGVSWHGFSSWDQGFSFACWGQAVRYLGSMHSNDKEDRRFQVGCQAFANAEIGHCVWTPFVNAWDEEFKFQCGQDHVFSGLWSYHDNHHEDRRFSFLCCRMRVSASHTQVVAYRPVVHTAWTGYANNWDASQSTWAPKWNAFCGMSSYHHNHHEDRRFRFKFCWVSSAIETGTFSYFGYSDWDSSFDFYCPSNTAMRYLGSYHNNGREDRRFRIGCQAFTNSDIMECPWTDYVNGWDAGFNFECPAGHVLAGLGSYHHNGHEDRRFRFRCCKWLVRNTRRLEELGPLSRDQETNETHAGLIDMDEDLAGPDMPQDERVPPNTTGRKLQAQRSREESDAVSWAATSAAQAADGTGGMQLWQVAAAFPAALAMLHLMRPLRGGACQQVQALEAGQTGQV